MFFKCLVSFLQIAPLFISYLRVNLSCDIKARGSRPPNNVHVINYRCALLLLIAAILLNHRIHLHAVN